jgi:hypothetical protein
MKKEITFIAISFLTFASIDSNPTSLTSAMLLFTSIYLFIKIIK